VIIARVRRLQTCGIWRRIFWKFVTRIRGFLSRKSRKFHDLYPFNYSNYAI